MVQIGDMVRIRSWEELSSYPALFEFHDSTFIWCARLLGFVSQMRFLCGRQALVVGKERDELSLQGLDTQGYHITEAMVEVVC